MKIRIFDNTRQEYLELADENPFEYKLALDGSIWRPSVDGGEENFYANNHGRYVAHYFLETHDEIKYD